MTDSERHFLGEEWRACCGRRLHIVQAARAAVVADVAKLAAESVYFVSHIGHLDAVCCVQLSWSLLALSLAIPALFSAEGQRKHRNLLPFIVLKVVECVVCACVLLLIFLLGVSGPIGYSALDWLIRWKYRRIEEKDVLTFTLATFLVISLLLVLNCYVLFTICRLREYFRLKALHLYSEHRNQIIRSLIRVQ
ncbi:hypothetical protein niasHS_017636 [Heterodera schachtii]|uniref:Uncharacterized protein n=1 Tax=Heterodera schachtii TaxID=97005 RepID=A0ABD2I447_HETSC